MSRASVSHRPKKLEVTVMFEPNRMASALLQAAYLRVAPGHPAGCHVITEAGRKALKRRRRP